MLGTRPLTALALIVSAAMTPPLRCEPAPAPSSSAVVVRFAVLHLSANDPIEAKLSPAVEACRATAFNPIKLRRAVTESMGTGASVDVEQTFTATDVVDGTKSFARLADADGKELGNIEFARVGEVLQAKVTRTERAPLENAVTAKIGEAACQCFLKTSGSKDAQLVVVYAPASEP